MGYRVKSYRPTFRLALSLGLALSLLAGCGDAERSDSATDADVQRLQSLPYAGSTPARPGERDGVVRYDRDRTCPGFNLYTVFALGLAELIDAEGGVHRTWSTPGKTWMHAELLSDGDLLVVGAGAAIVTADGVNSYLADETRFVQRFDWQGRSLWKKPLPGHHDIEVTPDGKLLLLAQAYRIIPAFDATWPVRDDVLTLLQADGSPIESCSLMEAIGRNDRAFPLYRVDPTEESGQRFLDLLHANSVEWMNRSELYVTHPLYAADHVLVCFRHQNRVAIFDWPDRRVVWSWGRNKLSGPHDAQLLAGGNLLVFDNGLDQQRSRIIELDPRTEEIVWQYEADPPTSFYTISKGSAQRLPNGNTLIAESDQGRAFEVTAAGDIVWEYLCPHRVATGRRAAIGKIRRYPDEFLDGIMDLHDR